MDVTGGHILTILAKEGGVIDGKEHRHGWLVDGDSRQGLRLIGIGDGLANLKAFHTDHRANIARLDRLNLRTSQALEHVQLLDLRFHH